MFKSHVKENTGRATTTTDNLLNIKYYFKISFITLAYLYLHFSKLIHHQHAGLHA